MTTLAVNNPRTMEGGERNEFPMIAADIVYEGAAVGIVGSSGQARPLTAADRFGGFAEKMADNSAGAAAAINVRTVKKGSVVLPISGSVASDVGLPVYATDDNTFTFSPVGGVFIGYARRYAGAGQMVVEFNAGVLRDPWEGWVKEAIADDKTLDVQDTGKAFFVTVDAKAITLPATGTGLRCAIVNLGAFGTIAVNVSPNANDKIMGPDIAGADNKDLINTKATARRGDYVILQDGQTDGYQVEGMSGTWETEA